LLEPPKLHVTRPPGHAVQQVAHRHPEGTGNPTWGTVKGIAATLGVSMGKLGKLADKLDA